MKSFEVKALGLEEITEKEKFTLNGGVAIIAIIGLIGGIITICGAIADAYDHREEIEEAYEDGYNSVRRYN